MYLWPRRIGEILIVLPQRQPALMKMSDVSKCRNFFAGQTELRIRLHCFRIG